MLILSLALHLYVTAFSFVSLRLKMMHTAILFASHLLEDFHSLHSLKSDVQFPLRPIAICWDARNSNTAHFSSSNYHRIYTTKASALEHPFDYLFDKKIKRKGRVIDISHLYNTRFWLPNTRYTNHCFLTRWVFRTPPFTRSCKFQLWNWRITYYANLFSYQKPY